MKLIASDRRNRLLNMINRQGTVKVTEAANIFNVTPETIRRDLKILNEQGKIQKEFGGAVSVSELIETPLEIRTLENIEVKQKLGLKAVEYCLNKNVIYLDSGSTVLEFAKILADGDIPLARESVAIVTNSFSVVDVVRHSFTHIFFLGGEVNISSMSTSGIWANNALSNLKMDIAFMGTSGFRSHGGPCVKTFADAEIKKSVLKSSGSRIVLADHSKFTSNAIIQYADWDEIDTLITDDNESLKDRHRIIAADTNVVVV